MSDTILCLTKRRPQGRDLYTSPYGRFFHLPNELAKRGHKVTICTLSYNKNETESRKHGLIDWHSISAWPNMIEAYKELKSLANRIQPNWIIGFSDTYFGILAVKLAKSIGAKSVVDAYDNYAAYIPWASPLHTMWFNAVSQADAVTVAGPSLAELFRQKSRVKDAVIVPMATDPDGYGLRDKDKCRQILNLPVTKKLVGYCGSISSSRDIETLFTAIEIVSRKHPDLQLVLSGNKEKNLAIPPNAIFVGFLEKSQIPVLLNACDVIAVTNNDSEFGQYSYPIKLYEAMACELPVVASMTEPAKWILRNHPGALAKIGDPEHFAMKIMDALELERVKYLDLPSWTLSGSIMDSVISSGECVAS